MEFSIIIPVYNRPDEVEELLASLAKQEYATFETIIVEDGSTSRCDAVVERYLDVLDIQYFYKENEGPGLTRNYGARQAKYGYLVFFDSDCIIPPAYFKRVAAALHKNFFHAYGGPDMAHHSFSDLQKAINYSMTSFLTTGGIRGGAQSLEKFKPRSFNMGYSKEVFEQTGGFSGMRFGEDIDMSIRIALAGYKPRLVQEAGVYHKRRTDLKKFFKQVYNSGGARINLFIKYPDSLKTVHLLPAIFTLGMFVLISAALFVPQFLLLPLFLAALFFFDAWRSSYSVQVALFAVPASFIQLMGYGTGFLHAFVTRLISKGNNFEAFKNNFYE